MSERKQAPYLFYGQTTSVCEECLRAVPAKILVEGDDVFYQKRCAAHGVQKTKISSDYAYFKRCKEFLKPGDRPLQYQAKTHFGCPLDCGLCPDHEQHSCLALIEINEECNLQCPVCFADSSPRRKTRRSLQDIEKMMDALVRSEGEPDVLQISGGEPTIHPQFFEILDLARTKPIRHLMVNTNGVRIANEPDFAKKLADYGAGFEVYLQFDSLKKEALENLRGADYRSVRDRALDNLERAGVSTTLVATVKRGVNDDEPGAIVEHALQFECVRGVTFQPIQDAGRNEGFDKNRDRVLLTDIRRDLCRQTSLFKESDIIPLPCNPTSIAIGYAIRNGKQLVPVTSFLETDDFLAEVPNAVSFEKSEKLKSHVYDLFSLSTSECNMNGRLESLLCCLPQVEVPSSDLGYKNVFRVSIVQFMDRYNFCVADVKRSCIHFVQPNGQIIPFDTFNLFYRDGTVDRLRKESGHG